ncbi:hypothetical protein [Plebeiibacterium sediminum]|uniref:Uncharacterized protein n=1 Tax=Plebeiibacterium sediminum TaxID=2992112 RepID=A0AAE3M994_9BACT|nr:hypothetical protein [Plebeiobacterium sediminum]MCW3789611.1 hypothetical protein [Plebeiobacterium sediminum]
MTSYHFDESKIDPYFSKLSYDELKEVICHFHKKDCTLPKIMEKYNLEKVTNTQFLKLLPPIVHPDNICPTCGETSHKLHIKRGKLSNPICPSCHKEMFSEVDPYEKLFPYDDLWEDAAYSYKKGNVKTIKISREQFETLDLDVKLFLGSLIHTGISKDFKVIGARTVGDGDPAPNIFYLKHLMTELGVGNHSPYAIYIEIEENIARKYFMPFRRLDLSLEEQLELWRKVALNEVIEIFYGSLDSRGLVTNQKEAIAPIMADLLKLYSVGQMVNLIWQALNFKYDEYLKGMRDKNHTANSIIYACLNFGESKKRRNQKVQCFNRPAQFPQSELSKYLFNDVLKIGDVGYREIPSEMELMKDLITTKQGDIHTFNTIKTNK